VETLTEQLAREGIHGPGTPQTVRFESDIARFLGREYARLAANPLPMPLAPDQGPMWSETNPLMEHHYDADLNLFKAFLDRRYMAYSMAYYGDDPEAIRASSASLEDAQQAKLRLVCERAELRGSERILSIGCGFGALETYLAETFPDASITAMTPSRTQADYIRACMRKPSHPLGGAALRLIHNDFSAVSATQLGDSTYDCVFAVAVLEHANNVRAVMAKVATLLRPGGAAFLHLIASRITIPRLLRPDQTLIGRYFPGGRVWPFAAIGQNTGTLELEASWFLNGLNYYRTLDAWHQRFWQHLPSLYPMTLGIQGVHHWNQYFTLCKACFAPYDGTLLGNGHFRLRKPD
jgi:cyclopropane-fatty-acyl-phospholipid synthase